MSDLQDIIASSTVRAFNAGYRSGSREARDKLRQEIIQNVIADAVISTNADVDTLERIVKIVDES